MIASRRRLTIGTISEPNGPTLLLMIMRRIGITRTLDARHLQLLERLPCKLLVLQLN
jgi:hypothetical protein